MINTSVTSRYADKVNVQKVIARTSAKTLVDSSELKALKTAEAEHQRRMKHLESCNNDACKRAERELQKAYVTNPTDENWAKFSDKAQGIKELQNTYAERQKV